MSSEERMAILKMLSEGKLSVDEAEKLLKAVGEEEKSDEPRGHRRRDSRRRDRPGDKDLGDMMQELGEEVRQAVQSVQASEIGRVVSQEVNRAVGSLHKMDIGRMVGDIVDQVKDAVNEAVEGADARKVSEEMEWTLDGSGLERVLAETTSGEVQVRGTDGDQVRVRACKRVRGRNEEEARAFLAEVKVNALREGAAVRVFKEHPKPPKGINVEVGYEIECPKVVDVDLRTVNGNVHCSGTEGAAQLQSTNGNVQVVGVKGRVEARTKNGNVSARVDELRHEGIFTNLNGNVHIELRAGQAPLTATSTNGSVEVSLPEGFGGRVDAKTTNGQVSSDLELTQVEESKRNLLIGQLGEGGDTELRLHTQNGSVRLKKVVEEEAQE